MITRSVYLGLAYLDLFHLAQYYSIYHPSYQVNICNFLKYLHSFPTIIDSLSIWEDISAKKKRNKSLGISKERDGNRCFSGEDSRAPGLHKATHTRQHHAERTQLNWPTVEVEKGGE
jgi:hypothetical protein